MGATEMELPVHDSLYVQNATSLYRTEEWWKAVVTYRFDGSETDETAVYLWHKDEDDWTRKNKYVVKTPEAWTADKTAIDRYFESEASSETTEEFPVSDYYTVARGVAIFKDDGWWKAIVNVVGKGSYETDEVMVYVWQKREGEWRRRQKATIKSKSDWEEMSELIKDHLDTDSVVDRQPEEPDHIDIDDEDSVSADLATLGDEISEHLSEEFR